MLFVFEHLQGAFAVLGRTVKKSIHLAKEVTCRRNWIDVGRRSFILVASDLLLMLSHRDTVQSTAVKAQRNAAIGREQAMHYHAIASAWFIETDKKNLFFFPIPFLFALLGEFSLLRSRNWREEKNLISGGQQCGTVCYQLYRTAVCH